MNTATKYKYFALIDSGDDHVLQITQKGHLQSYEIDALKNNQWHTRVEDVSNNHKWYQRFLVAFVFIFFLFISVILVVGTDPYPAKSYPKFIFYYLAFQIGYLILAILIVVYMLMRSTKGGSIITRKILDALLGKKRYFIEINSNNKRLKIELPSKKMAMLLNDFLFDNQVRASINPS